MELIAQVGERTERVVVERHGELYQVRVGEREYRIDARALGPFIKSLLVGGESHEASVFRRGAAGWTIGWRGRVTEVELVDPLTHLSEKAHGDTHRGGRQTVAAYMPGRVVTVSVEVGQAIEAGAPLVVLEAMKMQNEIQADRAGVVVKVHVAPGQPVEGGDPLVEIE